MLVLSRKIGQEIVIGDSVRVSITKVSGNRVTLGVEAPDHVRILRGELQPIVCSFEDDAMPGMEVSGAPESLADEASRAIPFSVNAAR